MRTWLCVCRVQRSTHYRATDRDLEKMCLCVSLVLSLHFTSRMGSSVCRTTWKFRQHISPSLDAGATFRCRGDVVNSNFCDFLWMKIIIKFFFHFDLCFGLGQRIPCVVCNIYNYIRQLQRQIELALRHIQLPFRFVSDCDCVCVCDVVDCGTISIRAHAGWIGRQSLHLFRYTAFSNWILLLALANRRTFNKNQFEFINPSTRRSCLDCNDKNGEYFNCLLTKKALIMIIMNASQLFLFMKMHYRVDTLHHICESLSDLIRIGPLFTKSNDADALNASPPWTRL